MDLINHILFIVDIHKQQSKALAQAITICQAHQAKLTLIHIIDQSEKSHQQLKSYLDVNELQAHIKITRQQIIQPLVNQVAATSIEARLEILFGKADVEIPHFIAEHQVNFIIKSTGSENNHLNFTSQDLHLIRKTPCQVLLCSPNTTLPINNILVAIDPSDDDTQGKSLNTNLLKTASNLNRIFQSNLHIIHAWELAEENDLRHGLLRISTTEIDTLLENLATERQKQVESLVNQDIPADQHPEIHLVKGEPSQLFQEFIEQHQIDLLILGTVGRSGLSGFFLGNTAENIIRSVNCSVLTIKPDHS